MPRNTVSLRPSIENGRAESAVANKSCRKYILLLLVANYDRQNPRTRIFKRYTEHKMTLFLIGASKDLATLTIYGVKKTQKMSYTKSSTCKFKTCKLHHSKRMVG